MPNHGVATRASTEYRFADLTEHFNNKGVSSDAEPGIGAFNIWSNTFPAEDLPDGEVLAVGGVPFAFPATRGDANDNVCCDRQFVGLPQGRYDWLYLVAAAERCTEDSVYLHYADGSTDPESLRISDFWPGAQPRFGERLAVRATRLNYPRHSQADMWPTLWRQRIPVPREQDLVAVRLPDNPSIHVFAITAQVAMTWGDD